MKFIRIFSVFLLLAFVFVSCEKSDIRPMNCGTHETTEVKTNTTNDQQPQQVNGRVMGAADETTPAEPEIDDIVGSGDDDRDGGDKKAKAVGR